MNPLRSDQIRGNWAALVLPIDADDRIDFARLADEIDVLVASGVDGLYSNGTTAEFYNQTEAEFDAIHALFAEKCAATGMPFQIGVSHMSPAISLERLRRVRDLHPGAVQVILPDWFPPTDAEAIAFLERMADASAPVGLVLYNPPHAKRKLQPEEIGRLADAVPALLGVKVAGGDADWYARMKAAAPDLSLFVAGHTLATGWGRGAHGAYSNVACLHPRAAQRWTDQMHTDLPAALELETRIQAFMRDCIHPFISDQGYSNQAVDKLLMAVGGWCDVGTRLRWPYRWIPLSEADRLRPIARDLLPEFFV
ncbi:dihydrodipicolinate synthase family protein [Aggregatilinea lenta]|uniref:dihydrodipicolinate synthase family protein n=1 Tax=Aggregatilinea lenta TaxID=913108 RepID=UPI000E5BEECA|nr:dihydrodipicolinate synthase family protein [Aggregatilinea lenta]